MLKTFKDQKYNFVQCYLCTSLRLFLPGFKTFTAKVNFHHTGLFIVFSQYMPVKGDETMGEQSSKSFGIVMKML